MSPVLVVGPWFTPHGLPRVLPARGVGLLLDVPTAAQPRW